jgi:hypothetical protein
MRAERVALDSLDSTSIRLRAFGWNCDSFLSTIALARGLFRDVQGVLAGVCARTQQAGDTGGALRRNGCRLDSVGWSDCYTALVVDCGGGGDFVRARVDLAFFRGAQQAGDIRASALVLVGGPKNDVSDIDRTDGRRSAAI